MNNDTDHFVVPTVPVPPKVYAVPRRFDLATIFTVTLAYAVLFALMPIVRSSVAISIAIAGFVTLVGVAQATLFGGQRPREASLACGAGSFLVIGIAIAIWDGLSAPFNTLVGTLCFGSFVLGGTLGYFAGVLVGGVFLVSDLVRRAFKRRRK